MLFKVVMSRFIKFLKWTIISMTILLLLIFVFRNPIIRFVFHDLPFMGEDFDRAVWFSALECKDKDSLDCLYKAEACLRGEMYRDLENNYLLLENHRSKVVELLGKPFKVTSNNCIDYELGFCSGLKIDFDYLQVCFDGNDKLKRVLHWQS